MTEAFQKKIFDAFVREDNARIQKAHGAGLGMTITKYIVDVMGGSIQVKSVLGRGSDFHVILDLEKIPAQETELRLPERDALLIERDPRTAQEASDTLTSIGLRPVWVQEAGQGCEWLQQSGGRDGPIPLILLDCGTPGPKALEDIRLLRRCTGGEAAPPLILLCDGDWGGLEIQARSAGVSGFIAKPLFRSSLFYGLRPFVEPDALQEVPDQEAINLSGIRILLAEDNELNWEVANELLSELGMTLEWAEDGQVCADKFRQSEPGWYDAVLMDLRMPQMTGYEAARAIRAMAEERPDAAGIPIIAMSADAFTDDVQRCMDCGMNAHTSKPIDVQEVVRLLDRHLHHRSSWDA